jgi:hypothetical protein
MRKSVPPMRSPLVILVLLLATIPAIGQPKNGNATANGNCSIAISGNNNSTPIARDLTGNCGIGKEQGDKIIKLLNAVLAKKDLAQMSLKLDELLRVASQPIQIYQNTSGPNSPNIAGNGNQVTYTNTSQLPVLSKTQIQLIKDRMTGSKCNVVFVFNLADSEANVFASDAISALKAAGCTTDFNAGAGGPGIQNPAPIAIGVRDATTPSAALLQSVLGEVMGAKVPGGFSNEIPEGQINVVLVSHPIVRPQ